ncbi:hypothetical protein OHA37_00535 [Streptomyces sp. NBC_00335]|uniref:hypothetical protein n=1 Tax=unclassified Streptomyces TaxID=2593676 RepID=UPI00225BB620|nr:MULTISPECIES: hypothetical protein [unclassified Streptomyces]MCX5410254.1 hypothetical protein [Streptomyces sp. NBC_00086]
MIDDEHDGYSEHFTGLNIDKPGLWLGERPAAEGPAPSARFVAALACDQSSAIYAALPAR